MIENAIIFWLVSGFTLIGGLSVILFANPVYAALSLVVTMIGVASVFVTLDAFFLAGVQLIVYAGAVTVLFVMVLMIFNLKNELRAFSSGGVSKLLKIASAGTLGGLIVGVALSGYHTLSEVTPSGADVAKLGSGGGHSESALKLGKILFTKYVFGFEILGILLLVVAIGAVALARSRGGTHAKL